MLLCDTLWRTTHTQKIKKYNVFDVGARHAYLKILIEIVCAFSLSHTRTPNTFDKRNSVTH